MAITYGLFIAPNLLKNTDTTLYTVPSTPVSTVMKALRLHLSNTTTSPVSVTLYTVPPSGAVGASTTVFPTVSIAGSDFFDFDVPDMGAGYTLQGHASTTDVVSYAQLDGYLKS